MHTSSGVDDIDEYAETVVEEGRTASSTSYGAEERPVTMKQITVPYKTATGMAQREFTVYRTHHGPIVREVDGKWVAVRLMQEPVKALTQSYTRTKAKNLEEFRETMELHTNSSNNTIFADADGNIAYFHANFVPKRDPRFDWTQAGGRQRPRDRVEGRALGRREPERGQPGRRVAPEHQQLALLGGGPRQPEGEGLPALRRARRREPARRARDPVLQGKKDFTLDTLRAAAYDSDLPAFEHCVPALVKAYDQLPASSPLKAKLAAPVDLLREWDYRWGVDSVATTAGHRSGARSCGAARRPRREGGRLGLRVHADEGDTAQQKLEALAAAVDQLAADFGTWDTPWGEINRFQRLTGDIVQPFDDAGPSIPVGFTSARWGSLASFGARAYPGHEELVRHQRQQLRGGGRVRRPREGQGGHGRRAELGADVEALQRPGRALRDGQPARRVLLS